MAGSVNGCEVAVADIPLIWSVSKSDSEQRMVVSLLVNGLLANSTAVRQSGNFLVWASVESHLPNN